VSNSLSTERTAKQSQWIEALRQVPGQEYAAIRPIEWRWIDMLFMLQGAMTFFEKHTIDRGAHIIFVLAVE
jgi:hypothetical protein